MPAPGGANGGHSPRNTQRLRTLRGTPYFPPAAATGGLSLWSERPPALATGGKDLLLASLFFGSFCKISTITSPKGRQSGICQAQAQWPLSAGTNKNTGQLLDRFFICLLVDFR